MEMYTTLPKDTKVFKFEFAGFSDFPKELGESVESPYFSHGGSEWAVKLYPGGFDVKYGGVCITLVRLETIEQSLQIHLESFSGPDGPSLHKFSEKRTSLNSTSSCYLLCNVHERYLVFDNSVCIQLTLTVYGEALKLTGAAAKKRRLFTLMNQGAEISSSRNRTLASDILSLFDTEDHSDISVVTSDGALIRAHKVFLAMRSEVFRAMFASPMSESTQGQITIDDADPAAVRAFVRCLYTNSIVNENEEENAVDAPSAALCCQLFGMAHKYQVASLQTQCIHRLLELLEATTAIDILSLGDRYEEERLQCGALNFICENAKSLVTNATFLRKMTEYNTQRMVVAMDGEGESEGVEGGSGSGSGSSSSRSSGSDGTEAAPAEMKQQQVQVQQLMQAVAGIPY